MLGILIMLLLLIVPCMYVVLAALVTGLRACYRAAQSGGVQARMRWLLGLNLSEPAVNSLFIPFLVETAIDTRLHHTYDPLLIALGCTAPMAILLLPALWLRSGGDSERRFYRQLLRLGIARWALAALTFSIKPISQLIGLDGLFFVALLILAPFAIMLLSHCNSWGKLQLETLLHPTSTIGAQKLEQR